MEDCIIIGGGPAGLTAALYLSRFLRSVTVFDTGGGRAAMIPNIHNLAPFPTGISGTDLLNRMRDHAQHYRAKIIDEQVLAVERQAGAFRVTTARESYMGRSIIFATGVFNHRPPLTPREHDVGVARGLIRYCPVCDAYEVREKRIAVLGNGAHGLQEAQFLTTYSHFVSLFPPDGSLAAGSKGVTTFDTPMETLALTDTEVVVSLKSQKILRFDTVYVAMGTAAKTVLAAQIGILLGESGHISVAGRQRTSVDRAFAIGDVTEGLDQIAVAMGQAAIAATEIHNSLN